jgi:hypothetical protein
LQWVAPPEQDEYQGYRIANNYVHHCGTDFYGAVGIFLAMAQGAVVAHNLIHDISYAGIVVGGNEDNNLPFARNNTVEYNHIYAVMKVAVDGAGIYASFFHADRGCLIRGNLIHDVRHNPVARLDGVFCFGIYLDGVDFRFITKDYRFENNVVYRNAGVPLFLWKCRKQDNAWLDNLFQKEGTLPQEFIEAVQARAGLEPAYRQSILKQVPSEAEGAESEPCNYDPLIGPYSASDTGWAAYQFDRPQTGQGVIELFRRAEGKEDSVRLKLRDLDTSAWYEMKGYVGTLARGDEHFYSGTSGNKELNRQFLDNIGDVLLLSEVLPLPLSDVVPVSEVARIGYMDGKTGMSGRELTEQGLPVKLAGSPQVVWIVYRRVK